MNDLPRQITLEQWDQRYAALRTAGLKEAYYGGPLRRHVDHGDLRLNKLMFDDSPAALRLWNFLLTEEERLRRAKTEGKRIVGTMKDLGTVPVMAYALDNVVAFYPDGVWWIPCVMELSAGLLDIADSLGIGEAFCPVRAMLGAFVTGRHFPKPDLLVCSVGAVCDDFSAIAQRLDGLGYPIHWWEVPHRRQPDADDLVVTLATGFDAAQSQIEFVRRELERVRQTIEALAGTPLDDEKLARGIAKANDVRRLLAELREANFTASICPLPALEMLIAEMLAIHFCSDQDETLAVLDELLEETRKRVAAGEGVLPADAIRVFWVNPVADLRVMNLLEQCGGRVCGTEYLFTHALDPIPDDVPPMEALARIALADPMVGSARQRAERICRDVRTFGSQAVLISRIPGASHCVTEGVVIADVVRSDLGIPVCEIEVPPISDASHPTIRTRIEALIETVRRQKQ